MLVNDLCELMIFIENILILETVITSTSQPEGQDSIRVPGPGPTLVTALHLPLKPPEFFKLTIILPQFSIPPDAYESMQIQV